MRGSCIKRGAPQPSALKKDGGRQVKDHQGHSEAKVNVGVIRSLHLSRPFGDQCQARSFGEQGQGHSIVIRHMGLTIQGSLRRAMRIQICVSWSFVITRRRHTQTTRRDVNEHHVINFRKKEKKKKKKNEKKTKNDNPKILRLQSNLEAHKQKGKKACTIFRRTKVEEPLNSQTKSPDGKEYNHEYCVLDTANHCAKLIPKQNMDTRQMSEMMAMKPVVDCSSAPPQHTL